jgi:hypothetical protein
MLNAIFTLDYEIHGNGDGSPRALMVEPTSRLLDLLEEYGAKLTIMADVAEILKFQEYRDQFGQDDYHYGAVVDQLKDAVRRGHDVQLHLHCSYFNARFQDGKWLQDWSEYNFARLNEQRINQVVRIGKNFLEEQLRPLDASYRCNVFRAANWSMNPSANAVRALVKNGFQIDTSVFKYGQRDGLVSFDYSSAPSNLVPWPVHESHICRRDEESSLLEVPIYTEQRWIGAFITFQRLQRAWLTRQHRVASGTNEGPLVDKTRAKGRLGNLFRLLIKRHAWKADFNQCSGRQLIRALDRAALANDGPGAALPFVLIGHSKLFTRRQAASLRPFLAHIARRENRFGFARFCDFDLQGLRGGRHSDLDRSSRNPVAA